MVSIVPTLPDQVRTLMERKLGLLKREFEQEHVGNMQRAFSRLRDGMREHLSTGAIGKVLISVPMEVYREMGANAVAMTKRWPMAVWDAMAHVLDKAGVRTADAVELSALVDKFAWPQGQVPFTLNFIQPERYRDAVLRSICDFGIWHDQSRASFERQLDLVAATYSAGIQNQGRQAREAVAIAIDEYVCSAQLESRASAGDGVAAPLSEPIAKLDPEQVSPCAVFKAMKMLTADEITITFVGDKVEEGVGANGMLEISARGESRRLPCAALDLVNRNNGRLNSQGVALFGLAQRRAISDIPENSKKVSRLREVFRKHLGIPDDPFEVFQQGKGWKPRFKVADRRGDADERARKAAENPRRTVSWDEVEHLADSNDRHEDLDMADDEETAWLREHDSD